MRELPATRCGRPSGPPSTSAFALPPRTPVEQSAFQKPSNSPPSSPSLHGVPLGSSPPDFGGSSLAGKGLSVFHRAAFNGEKRAENARFGAFQRLARAPSAPRSSLRARFPGGDIHNPPIVRAAASRVERAPTIAHPADDTGGYSRDEGMRGNVLRDHGARSHHRSPPDRDPAEDRRVRPDGRAVLDRGLRGDVRGRVNPDRHRPHSHSRM